MTYLEIADGGEEHALAGVAARANQLHVDVRLGLAAGLTSGEHLHHVRQHCR